MSYFLSCLWFNEVNRITSRYQLSFAYTYLKLQRLDPDYAYKHVQAPDSYLQLMEHDLKGSRYGVGRMCLERS
ncbi:hypothetical protein YC2023_107247 [Brassica napus]